MYFWTRVALFHPELERSAFALALVFVLALVLGAILERRAQRRR